MHAVRLAPGGWLGCPHSVVLTGQGERRHDMRSLALGARLPGGSTEDEAGVVEAAAPAPAADSPVPYCSARYGSRRGTKYGMAACAGHAKR